MLVEFNLWVVALFFISGLTILWFSKHIFKSYLAPLGIYGALWLFSLAFFHLGVARFYALEGSTILIFLCTMALFILGSIAASGLFYHINIRPSRLQSDNIKGTIRLRVIVYIIFVVGVFGTIVYYYRLHNLIGIESIWSDPIKVRTEESFGALSRPGWIGLARSLLIPCFVLAIISLSLPEYKRFKSMWFVAFTSIVLLLPSSGRTPFGTMILWAMIANVYIRNSTGQKTSFMKYVKRFGIIIIIFIAYFFITTNMLQKAIDQEAGVGDIAVYTVSSFPAFQEMLKYPEQFAVDTSLTFGMVSRVLHEIDPEVISYPEYVQPFVYIPTATNVYTYIDAFYLDFGWIGVIIFPYVIGFMSTVIYLYMLNKPSINNIYISSLIGLLITQSTGVNRFGNILTWIWIILPMVTDIILCFLIVYVLAPAFGKRHGSYHPNHI
jgi:oligosaccharide repeat unit polymerase